MTQSGALGWYEIGPFALVVSNCNQVLQTVVGTDENALLRLVEACTKNVFVNDDIDPKTIFTDYNLLGMGDA